MLRELILKNRSYRRFHEDHVINHKTLLNLIELARNSSSSGNLQPLKYLLVSDKETNKIIFPFLSWAGYLKDWPGPKEGERPSAYIVILGDKSISKEHGCDHGIAAQSIMLGAVEDGLGGCMIGTINRNALRKTFSIPDHLHILLVLALGKPKEKVVLKDSRPDGDIRYWRDKNGIHHVPKRPLDEIIIKIKKEFA